jgi:hypothetical protein
MPNPWATGTLVLSGLLTAGLLALPVTAVTSAGDAKLAKRDDDGTELVLVADDDDVDDDDSGLQKAQTRTRSRTRGQTRTRTRTNTGRDGDGTRTRTGANSGRDNSRPRVQNDWTRDGKGAQKRDWSQNRTNDRSRRNTRG